MKVFIEGSVGVTLKVHLKIKFRGLGFRVWGTPLEGKSFC